ncbi:MAG: hypothetical protein NTY22_01395 [Proteobacteria bacterium]|nr:hypothetical protein [Pseudomonadota bacterium]
MLIFFISAFILSLTPANVFDDQTKITPFYSIAVDEVDLSQVKITVDEGLKYPQFKKENKRRFILSLNKADQDYYNKLSELDKKIFVKLVSLGLFKEIKNKNYLGNQYTLLYKKDAAFNIETVAIIPTDYGSALPVITDYASYNDWALKDINIRRDGEGGKYFFNVNSLKYFTEKEQKAFELNVTMGKNFSLKLLLKDYTFLKPVPSFDLKMEEPSSLAKDVKGTFKFMMLPDTPYFIIYFTGKAEVSWIYYKFLPLNLIRGQFVERIYTMLENIQYKSESIKQRSLITKND